MPELPEVETIRRDLSKKILNKKIKNVLIGKNKIVKNPKNQFIKILKNNKFTKLDRIGKLLIFKLNKKNLLIHLKMTGQLIYQNKNQIIAGGHVIKNESKTLPNKYSHIIFEFTNNSKLFFNDLRQFGYLKIVTELELKKIKKNYGIEPLTKNFTLKNFNKSLEKRTAPIKAILLNQKLIAGLGNIYVDESLFLAGIRPSRRVNTLTKKEKQKLFKVINPLIKKAIKYRGTTFNNYVDAKGEKGNFYKFLKIYGRKNQKCFKCKTVIKKIKLAGRGTHYCSHCQK